MVVITVVVVQVVAMHLLQGNVVYLPLFSLSHRMVVVPYLTLLKTSLRALVVWVSVVSVVWVAFHSQSLDIHNPTATRTRPVVVVGMAVVGMEERQG